jgi:hypothetical protein
MSVYSQKVESHRFHDGFLGRGEKIRTSDPLTPRPEDGVAGAIIREHERHDGGEKPSCRPMITSDCLFVLPFARPHESWQVAVLVALELVAAMRHAPEAAKSLTQFRTGSA